MIKKEKIEQEVRKTLDQFENAEQLPPNPYFYTRVQARLEETRRQRNPFTAILKPVLLSSLIIINLGTVVWYLSGNEQNYQTDTRQELIEILVNDLKLDNNQSDILVIE